MKKISVKNTAETNTQRAKWRDDPCLFIETVLRNPEDGEPFKLYEEQKVFLRTAFQRTVLGRLKQNDLLWSSGKKGGKTALGAMIAIYAAVVLAGNGGEVNILANDKEQAQSRVFAAVANILRASPMLANAATIGVSTIKFKATGTEIKAYASDYAGFAGSNPTANIYDEGAYYTSEPARRLWDEGIPSPARKISFRLSVSTAGFEDEPSPLRDQYNRIMAKGKIIAKNLRKDGKLLAFWASGLPDSCPAPWQNRDNWIEDQRAAYADRPNQFLRLIENVWTSNENAFIAMEDWDACVDPSASPILSDPRLNVWVGLDASVNRDNSAVIAVAWDVNLRKVRLIRHRVFTPSKKNPIDFERDIEAEILDLRARFRLRQVVFDPFQLVSVSQRLAKLGVPMEPLNQTSSNLTQAGDALLELIRFRNLVLYRDDDMRVAVSKCVVKESSRGWKISKTSASAKIDSIVALSFAALAATQQGQQQGSGTIAKMHLDRASAQVARGMPIADAAAAEGLGADEVERWIDRQGANGRASRLAALTAPPAVGTPAPVKPGARWNPWCGTVTRIN
jgi:phage terminase large subunit-like protein